MGDGDLTFQPQLNQRSLQLAAEREAREADQGPAATRSQAAQRPGSAGGRCWSCHAGGALGRTLAVLGLNLEYARSAQPKPSLQLLPWYVGGPSSTASGGVGAFTFSPAINRASERLLEDSPTVPADFQERLRYYSQRKQLRQAAAAGAADAETCTFRPDTGNAVQVLAMSATRAGNLLETEQARGGGSCRLLWGLGPCVAWVPARDALLPRPNDVLHAPAWPC